MNLLPLLIIGTIGGLFLSNKKKSRTMTLYSDDSNSNWKNFNPPTITKFPGYEIKGNKIVISDLSLAENYAKDKGQEFKKCDRRPYSLEQHFIQSIYDLIGLNLTQIWYKNEITNCLTPGTPVPNSEDGELGTLGSKIFKKEFGSTITKLVEIYNNNSKILNDLYLLRLSKIIPYFTPKRMLEVVYFYLQILQSYGVNMDNVFSNKDIEQFIDKNK